MTSPFRLRSPLFAPGDSDRKMQKALASEADAVILDLEDSVAPAAKDAARALTAAALATPAAQRPGVIVRVNPSGTQWYLADLAAIIARRPDGVMLPKCSRAADLVALDHHMEVLEVAAGVPVGSVRVLPIVSETAASVLGLPSYRRAAPRVLALCFGAEDLSADLGIAPRWPDHSYRAPVAHARAALLVAAAAAGVPALDTPWADPRDPQGLAREAATAAGDGFSGKLCIHPDQIGPVNAAFSPPAEQVEWARRVLEAEAANPSAGVFTLDGKMIDQPHIKLARRIMAAAGL